MFTIGDELPAAAIKPTTFVAVEHARVSGSSVRSSARKQTSASPLPSFLSRVRA
ncbi:hypothetical protein [Natrinema sp. SYSU A 869]|uniref:hypothetical protein n=1 Tax=Natrinema sp. SYSU A 869 TaxID=2871694 RepID=UPI001CA45C94|nr:hypothetical protein [Natrinema sp. SYSU A 869]